MASASAPPMSDKPPTYNEATGSLNPPAGAVAGYGATGYPPQGQVPVGAVKSHPDTYSGKIVLYATKCILYSSTMCGIMC